MQQPLPVKSRRTWKKPLFLWKVKLTKSKPWFLCWFKPTKSEVRSKSCFFYSPEPKSYSGFLYLFSLKMFTLPIKGDLISGVSLKVWVIIFLRMNLLFMEETLPVSKCTFFSCIYQLSPLIHFRLCHLAKYWNWKVYLLERICKQVSKKDTSFSLLSFFIVPLDLKANVRSL